MADVKLVCLLLAAFPVISLAVVTLRQAQNDGSVVYQQFHVNSDIIARYAHTQINSVVLNSATTSKELSFQVQLPETAFISNFTMTVNGTTYYGIVKGKAEAQEEFEHRQSSGENVGLVESRGTNLFQIRINTAASSQSTFTLYYEELIVRRLSRYRQVINLNPGSKVEDFRVSVRVVEQQGVTFTGASDFVGTTRQSANEVLYSYSPSLNEQTDQEFGLARDMFVEYDVIHSSNAGLIVVNDCYFAQFFSPSGVEAVPVDIIFVIDVSGSMSGNKIAQTREALETIINQLRSEDRFTMVTFDNEVDAWNNRLVSVSGYRQQGVQFARGLQAGGGTNFAGGLETAIDILKRHGDSSYVQLLVMLTDGEPTVGETNPDTIVAMSLTSLAGTRISLNCLGFGVNLNFLLLQRLALSNNGIAKKIFEDSDAAQQLEGFFEEISSPILHTISVIYPDNAIESISQKNFPLLFNGSEIVVAGKFSADVCLNGQSVFVQVSGTGRESQVSYQTQVDTGSNSVIGGRSPLTERLAAYLNIQQLLDQSKIAATQQEVNATTTKALNLALRYNFVTELTSLIVVADDNFTIDDTPSGNRGGESLDQVGVYLAGPAVDVAETSQGGLSVQASASAGAIAGVILVVLFILSCLVAFVVVNVAIFAYIAYTRNNRSSIPRGTTAVGGDNHALLSMSVSVEEEVDKPCSSAATPPTSPEQNGGAGVVKSELTAVEEKEREAMGEMDEEEERYQPAPSGGGEKEITV